jgi:hypothetical protein
VRQNIKRGDEHVIIKNGSSLLDVQVIERSRGGLSFALQSIPEGFGVGSKIDHLRVVRGSETIFDGACEVRHITKMAPEIGAFRIGVQFEIAKGDEPRRASVSINDNVRSRSRQVWRDVLQAVDIARVKVAPVAVDSRDIGVAEAVRFTNSRGMPIAGLVNRTFTQKMECPVVLIASPFGRRKETMSHLATFIIENFRQAGKPVAVLRFDYTNSVGESYVNPSGVREGAPFLEYTVSGGVDDLHSALNFAHDNPWFSSREITLVSPSMSAVMARKTLIGRQDVKTWIAPMGVMVARDSIKLASDGVDVCAEALRGARRGITPFLGAFVDADHFTHDAEAIDALSHSGAVADLTRISADTHWILGSDDPWVNGAVVNQVLRAGANFGRHSMTLPLGHLPTDLKGALVLYRVISKLVWHRLVPDIEFRMDTMPVAVADARSKFEWANLKTT